MINPAEVGLAFVEGLALIASPCILPVLPLVLSGGVEGGKARPFGITLGFVATFCVFVLLSRQIVGALHIQQDTLRNASLVLLAMFGIIMLSETLSQKFSAWTQSFANVGAKAGASEQGGFGSGLLIGALIGLVWTPCAGPILAAVLVQVIRQQTDLQSLAVTLAFAVGASIPMLLITLAGKKLMSRFRSFSKHTAAVRKALAVLILLSVGFIGFQANAFDFLSFFKKNTAIDTSGMSLQDGLQQPYPAPEFNGIDTWLNSGTLHMQGLKGKIILVDFWTYSCINCVRTLPYLTAWDAKYRDKGLVIIGVHSPEFEFEKEVGNIQSAIAKYGIKYPVAVDNNLSTWVAFQNKYWPAHYLIDSNGNVVYTHFGEGKYDVTENNIRYLLGIKDQAAMNAIMPPALRDETAETYLGYGRADRFASMSEMQRDVKFGYLSPTIIESHHWALNGVWKIGSEKITSADKDVQLRLNFKAKKVFLVMGSDTGEPKTISLKLNGADIPADRAGKDVDRHSSVTVSGHALYELVSQKVPQDSELDIAVPEPGVEMYAFTFGE